MLPFTAVGLLTIGLFLLLESLDPATREQHIWPLVMQLERVLIIPVWLMRGFSVRVGIVLFGPDSSFPGWYNVMTAPILLFPHLALDWLPYGASGPAQHVTASVR